MAFGVTDEGFNAKRTALIIADLEAEFEARWPGIKTDGESVAGNVIGVFAAALGQAWEATQLANNQYDPSAARGANLSSLVLLNGLIRKDAEASTVTLTITADPSTVVTEGSQVSNADQTITVATDTEITIDGSGSGDVGATATETGPLVIDAGTMTNIVTPIAGWSTVTNSSAGVTGRDIESDQQLRERQIRTTFTPSISIVESIFSNLTDLDQVTFIRAYVNETGSTDARGITEHSVAVVIVGGDDDEIAETIFNHIPAGINTYGTTVKTVLDDQNFAYPIRFTRPTDVQIFVNIEIETDDTFPANGVERIKQAIVDYAAEGADSIGNTSGNLDGFPPGANVIRSRVYTPCNTVPGHNVTLLQIGKTVGTLAEVDLNIDWDEVSTWSTDDISVTIVG
jgi:uncharacterized phage protein gp47/JayE